MDAQQMQYEFGIQLNQFDQALELASDDIEYWLNKAQLDLVKEKFNGRNELRKGFEQTPQMVEDLRVLVEKNYTEVAASDAETTLDGYKFYQADLPSDLMFLLSIRAEVVNGQETKIKAVRFATQDTVYSLLDDPFNKSKKSSPLADINAYQVNIYTPTSGFTIGDVYINYIRTPREISIQGEVDCELPNHLHKEIIQRAVDLFLYNTRELKQRLQRETPVADTTQNRQTNE